MLGSPTLLICLMALLLMLLVFVIMVLRNTLETIGEMEELSRMLLQQCDTSTHGQTRNGQAETSKQGKAT